MFRAVRLAPSSNSVDRVSREALYRSQAARLTRVSRLDSPKPTDNLPFLPRAITHASWVEPSSTAAVTLAVCNCRGNVLENLNCCGGGLGGSAAGGSAAGRDKPHPPPTTPALAASA